MVRFGRYKGVSRWRIQMKTWCGKPSRPAGLTTGEQRPPGPHETRTPSHAGTRHQAGISALQTFKAERKSKRFGDPLPAMHLITYRPHQEGSGRVG